MNVVYYISLAILVLALLHYSLKQSTIECFTTANKEYEIAKLVKINKMNKDY